VNSKIPDEPSNLLLRAENLSALRKNGRRLRRIGPASRFVLPERLEALLHAPWFGAYLEQLVLEALAPYANIFTRKALASVRLELLDELTADPILRGLVAQIGTALETSHSGAVRVVCSTGARRAAMLGTPDGNGKNNPGMLRLSDKRTLKIY
jgi:hypothetical protein